MPRQSKPWWRASSGTWVSRVRGRLYTLAYGKGNRKAAAKKLHEILATHSSLTPSIESDRIDSLVSRYLSQQRIDLSKHSFERYSRILASFVAHIGDRPASSVRAIDVLTWLDSRRWNGSTRTLAIAVVQRMFNWSVQVGLLSQSPIAKVHKPGISRREFCPTVQDIRLLLSHLSGHAKEITEFVVETGCRPSEAMKATVADCKGSRIELSQHKTARKTQRIRVIWLNEAALLCVKRNKGTGLGLIFRNARGRQWTRHALDIAFREARRKTGLDERLTPYTLRHFYITEALARGVPVAVVARLVGTSLQMIQAHYGHLGEEGFELTKWIA